MDRCTVCGYSGCMATIDYHHLHNKKVSIASFFGYVFNDKRKDILFNELRKCVALCKNCHAELHAGYGIFTPRSEQ